MTACAGPISAWGPTMFSPDLLAGRRALITGGGTGLGRAIGTRFLGLGADLVICGRRVPVLEATAAEWRASASRRGDPHAGLRRARPGAGGGHAGHDLAAWPLDILVNNAAGNFLAQSHRLSVRAVDAVLGIVLHGSAYCTLGCGRRWIAAGRGGTVLSVLTLSALSGAAFTVPSAMAKAGVLAMTRSLAVEWGPHGIRCVAVAPGAFPTPGAAAGLAPPGLTKPAPADTIPLARVGAACRVGQRLRVPAVRPRLLRVGRLHGGRRWQALAVRGGTERHGGPAWLRRRVVGRVASALSVSDWRKRPGLSCSCCKGGRDGPMLRSGGKRR